MWNNSDTDTFDNIQNFILSIKDLFGNIFDKTPIFLGNSK